MQKIKPMFNKVDCISLHVPDLENALTFYHDNLGHEIIWKHKSAAGLRLPESNAELVLHTENRPNEVDWKVDSVPEAVDRFIKAGGELLAGPFEIHIGLCAVLRDPWQNPIVILDTSKGYLKVDSENNVIGIRD